MFVSRHGTFASSPSLPAPARLQVVAQLRQRGEQGRALRGVHAAKRTFTGLFGLGVDLREQGPGLRRYEHAGNPPVAWLVLAAHETQLLEAVDHAPHGDGRDLEPLGELDLPAPGVPVDVVKQPVQRWCQRHVACARREIRPQQPQHVGRQETEL